MLSDPPSSRHREPPTEWLVRHVTRERLWRYPVVLFVVTVGLYAVTLARSKGPIEPGGRILGCDYFAFYTGGDLVNQGRIEDLYDPAAHADYQQQFMQDINPLWTGTYPYRNPPHYALAMSWLALMDYVPSLAAWSLLSLLCFGAATLIWRTWLPRGYARLAIVLAICLPSWFQALAGGQNTFLTLAILTGFCALLMKGRDGWAGFVLSALSYKFYLIAVPAGLLVAKRRWRAILGLIAGGVCTLALTAVLLGPGVIGDYVRFVLGQTQAMQNEGLEIHKQHCWQGFFQLLGRGWMPPESVGILAMTASLASLALLVPVWRGAWDVRAPGFSTALAALMVATLLTSPHLLHYDMAVAALPAVLWLRAVRQSGRAGIGAAVKPVLVVGFCWLAVAEPIARVTHLQLSPLLMLWWLAALARVRFDRRATCPAHSPV